MSELLHRVWAMPSGDTFTIPPIIELLRRHLNGARVIVDPFARNSRIGTITNDLNPDTAAQHHMDATDFCRMLADQETVADVVLFDPPYSPRQISELYRAVHGKVTMQDTRNAVLYANVRDVMDPILKPGGIAISCGWNSGGFGKFDYQRLETLFVCHGAARNDTIVTVERKPDEEQYLFGAKA